MVTHQDQCQLWIVQQALFHDVCIVLIQGAGALVHQEDRAVMDQGTGDGHTLFLPTGEVAAFLTHDGVQAVGHGGQIARQGAVPQGLLHLLIGERLAQGDVVPDGGVEQEHVLFYIAHLLLKLFRGKILGIFAIKADSSAVVRQPAQQEFQQRGLSAAGGAGEGVLAALLKLEGQVLQNGLFTVLKAEAINGDGALYRVNSRLGLAICSAIVDGDAVKVSLGGCQGQTQSRNLFDAAADVAAQVAGASKCGLDDDSIEGQHDHQDGGSNAQQGLEVSDKTGGNRTLDIQWVGLEAFPCPLLCL